VAEQTTTGVLDEFQTDLMDGWRRLPNKAFFLVLLVAWLALFQFLGNSTFGYIDTGSLLKWMYLLGSAHSANAGETDDNQMLIAPLVVVGLFWWKRKELLSQPMALSWQGLVLVALGLLLHIIGYRVQQPRISIVALFIGIYGLMGLAWGPKFIRACFFPFFLFIFCVPFGTLSQSVTVPLQQIVTRIVEVISHGVGIHVVRQGTELMDSSGRFHYDVAAACAGIRSLIVTTLLAIVFGFVVFRSPWKRLLLVVLAAPLAVAGNVLRLMIVILVANWRGQEAGNWVHENTITSLLPYVPAVLTLFWLGSKLEKKVPQSGQGPSVEVPA
jgi:exosortase